MRRARYGKHMPWHQNCARILFDLLLIGGAFWLLFEWLSFIERMMIR